MSGESASHLVIFIASIVIAAGVGGLLISQTGNISSSVDEQASSFEERIDTQFSIISDTSESDDLFNGDESEIHLIVKNTGQIDPSIHDGIISILIDGQFVPDEHVFVEQVNEDNGVWSPGTDVRVIIDIQESGISVDRNESTRVVVEKNDYSDVVHIR